MAGAGALLPGGVGKAERFVILDEMPACSHQHSLRLGHRCDSSPGRGCSDGCNGSSQAGSCSACELVCAGAEDVPGGGPGEPLSWKSLAAHAGVCPGARVWYPPGQSCERLWGTGSQEGPGAWTAPGCSVPLTRSCPHSDGGHQEEAGDRGRWCLRKDVSADRVQQGPVPRGLRAHCVRELHCRHRGRREAGKGRRGVPELFLSPHSRSPALAVPPPSTDAWVSLRGWDAPAALEGPPRLPRFWVTLNLPQFEEDHSYN